jgi:hypothetical protein
MILMGNANIYQKYKMHKEKIINKSRINKIWIRCESFKKGSHTN